MFPKNLKGITITTSTVLLETFPNTETLLFSRFSQILHACDFSHQKKKINSSISQTFKGFEKSCRSKQLPKHKMSASSFCLKNVSSLVSKRKIAPRKLISTNKQATTTTSVVGSRNFSYSISSLQYQTMVHKILQQYAPQDHGLVSSGDYLQITPHHILTHDNTRLVEQWGIAIEY